MPDGKDIQVKLDLDRLQIRIKGHKEVPVESLSGGPSGHPRQQ